MLAQLFCAHLGPILEALEIQRVLPLFLLGELLAAQKRQLNGIETVLAVEERFRLDSSGSCQWHGGNKVSGRSAGHKRR